MSGFDKEIEALQAAAELVLEVAELIGDAIEAGREIKGSSTVDPLMEAYEEIMNALKPLKGAA